MAYLGDIDSWPPFAHNYFCFVCNLLCQLDNQWGNNTSLSPLRESQDTPLDSREEGDSRGARGERRGSSERERE